MRTGRDPLRGRRSRVRPQKTGGKAPCPPPQARVTRPPEPRGQQTSQPAGREHKPPSRISLALTPPGKGGGHAFRPPAGDRTLPSVAAQKGRPIEVAGKVPHTKIALEFGTDSDRAICKAKTEPYVGRAIELSYGEIAHLACPFSPHVLASLHSLCWPCFRK